MNDAEKLATELGKQRGWEYANSYGGTVRPKENEIEIPYYAEGVETFYIAAYLEGIEEYLTEHAEDDETPDLYEYEWVSLTD